MKQQILSFISRLLSVLTWQRLGLFFLACLTFIAVLTLYENRALIVDKTLGLQRNTSLASVSAPWELSDVSKQELKKLTNQAIIGGVLLTEVNLKKNHRVMKHWYVRDPQARAYIDEQISNLLPQPFFDLDQENNTQMLAVLNNQFTCDKTESTIFAKILPALPATFPYVCRLSVPPFVGEFAGMITIALVREPTQIEKDTLKIELARISIDLYTRDIKAQK